MLAVVFMVISISTQVYSSEIFNNRTASNSCFKQAESASQDGALCFNITGKPQGTAHEVWGKQ
jgi:hypothetical protein